MTTNPPQIVFNHIVAFEVSKEKLVVHTLPDDEQWTIDNKPQAVRRLIKAEIKRNRKKTARPDACHLRSHRRL